MDGTWRPPKKVIKYVVCPSCKRLVKKDEIVKGLNVCRRCAQI